MDHWAQTCSRRRPYQVTVHAVLPKNFKLTLPSAIDNATRSLISLGQMPVTCGLYFSLGHSTIVIAVNIAIAISTDVYDHINGVGQVGGIVGTAISASFLFIIGLANSIILGKVIAKRRKRQKEQALRTAGSAIDTGVEDDQDEEPQGNTLMMRILGPIVKFVDKPWKMYPVGVLFGFGFDTASSIALLAVSAIAKTNGNGAGISSGDIVILPLLFTVGMTLVDSVDSIIMLYSYSGFLDRSFAIFERSPSTAHSTEDMLENGCPGDGSLGKSPADIGPTMDRPDVEVAEVLRTEPVSPIAEEKLETDQKVSLVVVSEVDPIDERIQRDLRLKRNAISNLSILLTLMSILVAFSISLIEIMSLIGDNCSSCQAAANAPNGGGLAGRWWRGWDNANNNSGYIGAAIVGFFLFTVASWYGGDYAWKKLKHQNACAA